MQAPLIVFPMDLLDPPAVDTAYENEAHAARECGREITTIDTDALQRVGSRSSEPQLAIYRGWMLKPETYAAMHAHLDTRGLRLINTPDQYRHAHYLPESYDLIRDVTPQTIWLSPARIDDAQWLADQLVPFAGRPLIVKDYVKSQKHYWHEACYIPSAADTGNVQTVVRRFLELQEGDLNVGVVLREYVPLATLGVHPRSGMPLGVEYRCFVLDGTILSVTPYWDDGDWSGAPPPVDRFLDVLEPVQSRFFTADFALTENGDWIVVELGDGQVAGLPSRLDPSTFYQSLVPRSSADPPA